MAQTQDFDPSDYVNGKDRYIRFCRDFLDLQLAEIQEKICRSVAMHPRTLVWGANGPGKSYITAALKLAYLYTNPDSIVLGTSGSYGQYYDTMWRPLESMHKKLKRDYGLPGRTLGGAEGARLEIDSEWFAKMVSPRDPGELEGRHSDGVLVIIDEADKRYIERDHFDSAASSVTDLNDRMIAICNPPEDESDIVYRKKESDRWNVIDFSAFDAHNVRVDAGIIDDDRIPGIVDLITIASDWEEWNGEAWPAVDEVYNGDWPGMPAVEKRLEADKISRNQVLQWLRPGFEQVAQAHEDRTDLDRRWYIRRVGKIPPDTAAIFRPFTIGDVKAAWEREARAAPDPDSLALDVARKGGDRNVLSGQFGDVLEIMETWEGVNHTKNEEIVERNTRRWTHCYFPVDAQGEGSGLADRIAEWHPRLIRFNAGEEAAQVSKYYDRWTEGLIKLGQFLRDGGCIKDRSLKEELMAAAKTVEIEERYYKTRESTVFKASSKDKVKDSLERSPDLLDSAYMAVWAASGAPDHSSNTQRLVW